MKWYWKCVRANKWNKYDYCVQNMSIVIIMAGCRSVFVAVYWADNVGGCSLLCLTGVLFAGLAQLTLILWHFLCWLLRIKLDKIIKDVNVWVNLTTKRPVHMSQNSCCIKKIFVLDIFKDTKMFCMTIKQPHPIFITLMCKKKINKNKTIIKKKIKINKNILPVCTQWFYFQ